MHEIGSGTMLTSSTGAVQGQLMNHQTNQNNTDPSSNPTDNFGIARSEYPGQVCSCVVAKHANGFEAENPPGVETDG